MMDWVLLEWLGNAYGEVIVMRADKFSGAGPMVIAICCWSPKELVFVVSVMVTAPEPPGPSTYVTCGGPYFCWSEMFNATLWPEAVLVKTTVCVYETLFDMSKTKTFDSPELSEKLVSPNPIDVLPLLVALVNASFKW